MRRGRLEECVDLSPTSPDRAGAHAVVRRAALLALIAIALAWPAAAADLYYSPGDDGVPAGGAPTIAPGGTQPVPIWIDGGAAASAPGTVCDTGAGDEVCGFVATLTATGSVTFDSFVADGGADVVARQTPTSLVINGLDPVSPTPGPQRIGVINVNTGSDGSVERTSTEVIGADLGSAALATQTLVNVPEPGALAAWTAGLGLLSMLARRRAAR